MKMRNISIILLIITLSAAAYGSSLEIETNYRNRMLSYANPDFNNGISTDAVTYFSQKLQLSLKGKFDTGTQKLGEQIEINTKIQAIGIAGGVAGSSSTPASTTVPIFSTWQDDLPYPSLNYMPFIEHSFVRISNTTRVPLQITIGKQPVQYGSGLIIGDNGVGYDAIRCAFQYPKRFNFDFLLTSVMKQGFHETGNASVSGLMVKTPWKDSIVHMGYFMEKDLSGTTYTQGINSIGTKSINKNYLNFIVGKKDEAKYWDFEAVFQNGNITQSNDTIIGLRAYALNFTGEVMNKSATGSWVSYRLGVHVASGEDNGFSSLNDDYTSYSPTYNKKYDGMELSGYGNIMGLSSTLNQFIQNQENFSGFGVIAFGATSSPMYGFEYGFDGFMHSAAGSAFAGAPEADNFTKNLLQSKYNLGLELNLFLKYTPSKYLTFRVAYSRYTPPTYTQIWPTNDTCDMYLFETICRF